MEITNDTFNKLMQMKKKFNKTPVDLPSRSQKVQLNVISDDEKENFIVDIDRSGSIEIKSKLQNRYSNNQILIRVEINSPPHTNPDGTTTSRDHIHVYREGYGLSWAYDLNLIQWKLFDNLTNFNKVFIDFCYYCNIDIEHDFQMVI